MVTVKIDEEDLLETLKDRISYWTDDRDVLYIYMGNIIDI